MQKQVRKKPSSTKEVEIEVEETDQKKVAGEELKAELDDLLDEIDEVLEHNAERFVKGYIQAGGQ